MMTNFVLAAVGAITVFVTTSTAMAQNAATYCDSFAKEIVANSARGKQTKCPAFQNANMDQIGFSNWCQRSPRAAVEKMRSDTFARLDGCLTSYGGSGGGVDVSKIDFVSGTYVMKSSIYQATIRISAKNGDFTGTADWGPGIGTDPIVDGRVTNGRITFKRLAGGKSTCIQSYEGKLTGTSSSGSWVGCGGKGKIAWTMQKK